MNFFIAICTERNELIEGDKKRKRKRLAIDHEIRFTVNRRTAK